MKYAVLFAYWILTILFVLFVVGVFGCLGAAVWTEDGRWAATAVLSGIAAFVTMFLAASIEVEQ